VRDYFYAEDGALANILLAQKLRENPDLRGHAFNFSNEAQVTVLALVQRLAALMGSKLEPEIRNEAVNEIRHQYLSAAKARKVLGWEPTFTLDEGLQQTIEWYRAFLNSTVR
jgi:CDP-glucose 4,6-dehydratase